MVIYASAVTLAEEWSANNKRCWPTPKFQHRLESPQDWTQLSPWLIILWRVAGLITPWFFGTFFLNLSFVIVSLNWISTSHCWFVKVVLSTRPTPSCCQKIATWLQSQTFWTDRFMSTALQSNWKFHTHNNLQKHFDITVDQMAWKRVMFHKGFNFTPISFLMWKSPKFKSNLEINNTEKSPSEFLNKNSRR